MKLIIAGATGLVGTEIVKQSLRMEEITSVIALARQPIKLEGNVDAAKLKSVVVKDYEVYPDNVRVELAGADACIWTVAVTPFRSTNFEFAEVKRVCQTCTMAGFKTIYEARPASAFRFIYLSAEGTPRDLSKKPLFMGEYQIMRGETEHLVLGLPKSHEGVDVCIARPGLVTNSTTWGRAALAGLFNIGNFVTRNGLPPNVSLTQLSAAVLDQAVHGFERETLSNNDLVRLGTEAMEKKK